MPLPPAAPMEPLSLNRLPSTDALSGTVLALDLVDGGTLELAIADERIRWIAAGVDWAGEGDDPSDVVEAAPGVYLIDVDFEQFERGTEAVTVVADVAGGWALVAHQERFHPEQTWSRGPEVTHTFAAARIRGAVQSGEQPAPTRELIGHRHLYRYSPRNVYEHIYINSGAMCGHNVNTMGTPGRADCHPASYHRIRDGVYLVGWREYDSAAGMLAVIDLGAGQATGKVLHPEHFLRSVSRPFGGPIIWAGAAPDYPDGLEPR